MSQFKVREYRIILVVVVAELLFCLSCITNHWYRVIPPEMSGERGKLYLGAALSEDDEQGDYMSLWCEYENPSIAPKDLFLSVDTIKYVLTEAGLKGNLPPSDWLLREQRTDHCTFSIGSFPVPKGYKSGIEVSMEVSVYKRSDSLLIDRIPLNVELQHYKEYEMYWGR